MLPNPPRCLPPLETSKPDDFKYGYAPMIRTTHSVSRLSSCLRPAARCVATALCVLALAGCASSGGIGKAVNRTLESIGIKDGDGTPEQRTIPLRLYAGDNLNAGNDGRALAAVVKVYHLRDASRFERAPLDAFLDETREREALGDDLLSVDEIVLTPGAQHEIGERLDADANVIGVAVLFRAPAANRWRLAFDTHHKRVEKDGITIGIHACALTTSSESLVSRVAGNASSLASAKCGAP